MTRIQHDDAVRLIRRLDHGPDHLGIEALEPNGAPSPETVMEHAARMLAGEVVVPDDAPLHPLDPIAARLLAHVGADPLAAAALSHAANGLGIEGAGEDADRLATLIANVPMALVHADPLAWDSSTWQMEIPRLAETLVAAAADGPLSRVMSHPALDDLDILVIAAWNEGTSPWTTLHLDPQTPQIHLDRDQLAALGAQARDHRQQ